MSKAYLNAQEIERLEDAATNLRDRLLLRVLSHLGCRVSEALALEVKDIDFSRGSVTIEHLKTRTYFKIDWGATDYILLVIGLLGIVSLVYSNVPIIARFRRIAQKNSSQEERSS